MKICKRCNECKDLSEFGTAKSNKDGKDGTCKACRVIITREWSRTYEGRIKAIYAQQKESSVDRGHPLPAYTLEELREFTINNNYDIIYNNWVQSNYNKNLAPSIDRIISTNPYTLDNIRLVTWAENNEANWVDRKQGKRITKQNNEVVQFTLEGDEIARYPSITYAARVNGFCRTNINNAIINNCAAHDFMWQKIEKKKAA